MKRNYLNEVVKLSGIPANTRLNESITEYITKKDFIPTLDDYIGTFDVDLHFGRSSGPFRGFFVGVLNKSN